MLAEILWLLISGRTKSSHILTYLLIAEQHEYDAWLRDDYRIARITVALAAKGNPSPFVEACYLVLGLHPAKISQEILKRREIASGKKPPRSALSLPQALPQAIKEERRG
jgi:hypothetical protein